MILSFFLNLKKFTRGFSSPSLLKQIYILSGFIDTVSLIHISVSVLLLLYCLCFFKKKFCIFLAASVFICSVGFFLTDLH